MRRWKKRCQVEETSRYHSIADDSTSTKMALIILESQLLICKLKKGGLTGLSVANPNFFWNRLLCWIFAQSFQAIGELICCKCMGILVICSSGNPNFSFQNQILRSWGWDLTMLGRQWKSTIVASVVYVPSTGLYAPRPKRIEACSQAGRCRELSITHSSVVITQRSRAVL